MRSEKAKEARRNETNLCCSDCFDTALYPQRRELFLHQKAAVEAEIERMNRVLDMLRFKCWYYEQAIRDGNEDRLSRLQPEEMPENIRQAYEHAHSMDE